MTANKHPGRTLIDALKRRFDPRSNFLAYAALRFYNDNCFQTAASLTYTTLLALVPIMTIGFAIFTAFPAFGALQNDIQALIFRNIVPEIGDSILEYLHRFVANTGQLTIFGVIGLAVSAVLLIWTIEGSFAGIWRVRESRSLVLRILSFWAIVSLAPLFAGASLSLSITLSNALSGLGLDDTVVPLPWFSAFLPMMVSFAGFSLLYLIVPNRPIEPRDALIGGLVGAMLFEASKAGFAWYLRAFPAYRTIYGALSTVPIFLFWLYIGWTTVLFGAVVTAARPEWRAGRLSRGGLGGLLSAQRLALALAILRELHDGARFGVGLRRRTLVNRLEFGSLLIDGLLEQLRAAHWVALTTRDSWVVTRDLDEATLHDLLRGLNIGLRGSVRGAFGGGCPWLEPTVALLETAERAQKEILSVPVKSLLGHKEAAPVAVREGAA
jgi:membrane protein